MKVYIETYGCQMNIADSEIVMSILSEYDYEFVDEYRTADFIFMNTCSIRDNAEQRVINRLKEFGFQKRRHHNLKIGILGCMAERLKEKLLEEEYLVDIIAGPDAYRDLPNLMKQTASGQKAANTILSEEETYAEIAPVRLGDNAISAFIAIMRGCENYCAYCVVPYTRGKERSRDYHTIIKEASDLFDNGYREVTLLGQNVNSYTYEDIGFAKLMAMVAEINPLLRVRFSTSHPKDLSDELLYVIAKYPNICKSIHLPVQSGSTSILKRMKRNYDRDWYLNRIKAIKEIVPNAGISTDIITGFCGETEQEHADTLSLMKEVGYDFAFMFAFSERPDTFAAKHYKDDVPENVKNARLNEVIIQQQQLSFESNKKDVGKTFEVLVEGVSKRSDKQYVGRTSQNKVVVFDRTDEKVGDYINVKIERCSPATLFGSPCEGLNS